MNESDAITLLKTGNLCGLEMLVEQYYFQAVRAAYLIVLDKSQAEDIVQTAFIHAFEKISQLSSDRFGPWFLRSVIHASIKSVTKQKRFVSIDGDDEEEVMHLATWLMDPKPSLDEVVESKELHQGVWSAIGTLTAQQRAAIVLKYYLDMSEAEMAKEFNLPQSTIKWRLYAAREKLRQLLNPLRSTG